MDRAPSHAKSSRRRRGLAGAPHRSANRKPALAPARRALLALLTASFLAVCAPSASAVIVHLHGGKTLSYQPLRGAGRAVRRSPFDEFFSNLDYNGGPVMASNTNYTFYWDPPARPPTQPNTSRASTSTSKISPTTAAGTKTSTRSRPSTTTPPAGFAGYDSHFAGAIIDTDPYPANGCTRATDLPHRRAAAGRAQRATSIAHGLPAGSHPRVLPADAARRRRLLRSVRQRMLGGLEPNPSTAPTTATSRSARRRDHLRQRPVRDGGRRLRRRQPPQRQTIGRGAGGRPQPRAQRVDHRPRTEQRLDGHRRQRRRDRRQVRGAAWARRSAKPPTARATTR